MIDFLKKNIESLNWAFSYVENKAISHYVPNPKSH